MTKQVRLQVLLSLLTVAGCNRHEIEKPELPQSISPGWQLASYQAFDPTKSPEPVRSAKPKSAWIATYRAVGPGAGEAHARIWPATGSLGLDLVQRWSAQANTVVFYSSEYFAAVDWTGVDKTRAASLVRAIQKSIGK